MCLSCSASLVTGHHSIGPQRRTGRGVFTGVDLGPAIRLRTVGPEAPGHKVPRRLAGLGSLPRFPGELAGVSLQVLILGPPSVSALWVRKHPDTKCRDGWRASVLYLDSLGYCCRFCAKLIKDYKQPGRVVLKRPLTPLVMHWSNVFLALTYQNYVSVILFSLQLPFHPLNFLHANLGIKYFNLIKLCTSDWGHGRYHIIDLSVCVFSRN